MEKVKAFADWLTKWFTVIVIVWAVFNYFVPAASLWGKAYTGYMLGIVLFGMGLTLTLDDFKRILTQPLMVIIGTVAHFIIMPLIAVALCAIFHLSGPLAVGVILWAALYNQLLLTAVNPQLAQSRGIAVKWVEYAFVILVAVAVMLSIRWVGVLLINALLILPAAAARNIARSVAQHALLSVLISVFSGVAGLCVSVPLGCGVGAAVVLCAAVCYAVSLLLGRALRVHLQA